MGWRHFSEIKAWQLSMDLNQQFSAILARRPGCLDRRFCEDVRNATASSPRNIAEGFGRFGRREFANFVNVAYASLCETQTNLHLARNRGYMNEAEFTRLWALSEQTVATTLALLKRLNQTSP